MSGRLLKIGEVARLLGVSTSRVRDYAREGRLEFSLTPGGQRVFDRAVVDQFMGVVPDGGCVFYVRSSKGDRAAMDAQVQELTEAFGQPSRVYRDAGSGLNENRKCLWRLINDAERGGFSKVCVTHEDRLSRFGVAFIGRILKDRGVEVVVLHDDKRSNREEILSDFMAILASFSGRYYRLRSRREQNDLLDEARSTLNG